MSRLIFICPLLVLLAACGGGSSSSEDARGKANDFIGTQTITLNNAGNSATETDSLTLSVNQQVITLIDEDFNATGALNSDNQFVISSPMFSTTSGGITCTGNVVYNGQIAGNDTDGTIQGEFNCSGTVFDLTGEFSASR